MATSAHRRALSAVPLVLAALGCGDATGPRDDLATARGRWRVAQPRAYEYTLTVSCFCALETRPVVVTVQDGVVRDRRLAGTNEPVTRSADSFPPVEGLFEVVAGAIASRPEDLRVTYDRALGHPARIWIDYQVRMADDEIGYSVSNLHAIPTAVGAIAAR